MGTDVNRFSQRNTTLKYTNSKGKCAHVQQAELTRLLVQRGMYIPGKPIPNLSQ